jgi:predicted dehydrogenase
LSTARTYHGALIGAGGIARTAHLPGVRAGTRLEIVAALDSDPNVGPLDGVPLFRDRSSLLASGPLDFVDVCTPPSSHLPLALWALSNRLHVICEKPVATTRADAAALATAARGAGRVVVPCHQYRFNPVWHQIGEWIRDGAIGHWHLAELSVYRLQADGGEQAWRSMRAESSGGILLDHGTHLLYSLFDIGGEPRAVQAWTGRLRHRDYEVEDTAQLLITFPDRIATVLLTWAAGHRENRVRLFGERGTIDWHGGILSLERTGQPRHEIDYTAQLDKRSYAGWFTALFRSFADAIDRGEADEALADITRVAAVLEAAYESARAGCAVSLTRAQPVSEAPSASTAPAARE